MVTGLEMFAPVLKWSPIAGAIILSAVAYGTLSSDVKNIQQNQVQQFTLIQNQLAAIQFDLNKK